MIRVIVPSKWQDLFSAFVKNNPFTGAEKVLVRDGYNITDIPDDWSIIQGKQPFIYARAINQGLQDLNTGVIHGFLLCNDDVSGLTDQVITELCDASDDFDIVSPHIQGLVGNPLQAQPGYYGPSQQRLAFVCVLILGRVVKKIGLLDERFIHYGYDDDDYCRRAQEAGFTLGITNKASIIHAGNVSFSRKYGSNIGDALKANGEIYGFTVLNFSD